MNKFYKKLIILALTLNIATSTQAMLSRASVQAIRAGVRHTVTETESKAPRSKIKEISKTAASWVGWMTVGAVTEHVVGTAYNKYTSKE